MHSVITLPMATTMANTMATTKFQVGQASHCNYFKAKLLQSANLLQPVQPILVPQAPPVSYRHFTCGQWISLRQSQFATPSCIMLSCLKMAHQTRPQSTHVQICPGNQHFPAVPGMQPCRPNPHVHLFGQTSHSSPHTDCWSSGSPQLSLRCSCSTDS